MSSHARKLSVKKKLRTPRVVVEGAEQKSRSNLITTKGQVTIPQNIREEKGFLPNTAVEFVIEGERVYLEKSSGTKSTRGQQIVQHLKGRCKTRMTTEDLMKLTRGD